jgi:hypothetical protein
MDQLVTAINARRISSEIDDALPQWEVSIMILGGVVATGRGPSRWIAEMRAMANLSVGELADNGPRGV